MQQQRDHMTETQVKAIPGLASSLLDLQQGDGTPLEVQKTPWGIFSTQQAQIRKPSFTGSL